MAKLKKRVRTNENRVERMHAEMNMRVGPARIEPLKLFVLPDLDPMQRQMNRIENMLNHEARCARRRAWRKATVKR